jgi:hypothetical protein
MSQTPSTTTRTPRATPPPRRRLTCSRSPTATDGDRPSAAACRRADGHEKQDPAVAALEPSDLRSDLWAGLKQGVLLAAAALVLTLPPAKNGPARVPATVSQAPARHAFHGADFAAKPASADARFVADWVADSGDSRGLPFIILDKRDARVFVFGAEGRLIDSSPVLLGATPGDDSVADIGTRPMASVREDEKDDAGRTLRRPGRQERIAGRRRLGRLHQRGLDAPCRLVDPKERRLERLASADPADRRISYGCINVPVAFFDTVVWPLLRSTRAVVYVLPEVRDVHEVFAAAYPVPERPRSEPRPARL